MFDTLISTCPICAILRSWFSNSSCIIFSLLTFSIIFDISLPPDWLLHLRSYFSFFSFFFIFFLTHNGSTVSRFHTLGWFNLLIFISLVDRRFSKTCSHYIHFSLIRLYVTNLILSFIIFIRHL